MPTTYIRAGHHFDTIYIAPGAAPCGVSPPQRRRRAGHRRAAERPVEGASCSPEGAACGGDASCGLPPACPSGAPPAAAPPLRGAHGRRGAATPAGALRLRLRLRAAPQRAAAAAGLGRARDRRRRDRAVRRGRGALRARLAAHDGLLRLRRPLLRCEGDGGATRHGAASPRRARGRVCASKSAPEEARARRVPTSSRAVGCWRRARAASRRGGAPRPTGRCEFAQGVHPGRPGAAGGAGCRACGPKAALPANNQGKKATKKCARALGVQGAARAPPPPR